MEEFLIEQVRFLTIENKRLQEEIKALHEKHVTHLESNTISNITTIKNKGKDLWLKNNFSNAYSFDNFRKEIYNILTLEDSMKYNSMSYIEATMCSCRKIFANKDSSPVHTYDKKNKIIVIKNNANEWTKISFIEFIDISKKILNTITGCFTKILYYEKKNKKDQTVSYLCTELLVKVIDDNEKHAETLANKLIDLLVVNEE
jgi:hypothetical protein